MLFQIVYENIVLQETAIGIADALFIRGVDSTVTKIERNYNFGNDDHDDGATKKTTTTKKNNKTIFIILGVQRYHQLPKLFIAVQTEQDGSKYMTDSYLLKLRKAALVWDFSPKHVTKLKRHGLQNVLYFRMRIPLEIFVRETKAFHRHFQSGVHQDIDVLFYGAKNGRRCAIQKLLQKNKITNVFRYYDLFYDEREKLISRAKIVLNIHYFEDASLETHRVEYLCARGKCILSERSADPGLDREYSDSILFCDIDNIVHEIQNLLADPIKKRSMEINAQRTSFVRQFSS